MLDMAEKTKSNYYDVLGVPRDADEKTLKSAFRKLAMQLHPDKNPGDATAETRFKEANEAYEVLKDADKRAAYDRFGHAAFEPGMGMGGGRGGGRGPHADFSSAFTDFSGVFDDLFGDFRGNARGGRQRAARGSDLRYNLRISLEADGRTVLAPSPVSMTLAGGETLGHDPRVVRIRKERPTPTGFPRAFARIKKAPLR